MCRVPIKGGGLFQHIEVFAFTQEAVGVMIFDESQYGSRIGDTDNRIQNCCRHGPNPLNQVSVCSFLAVFLSKKLKSMTVFK